MTPDLVIDGYMERWHLLPKNRWFNVYLNHFIGPDMDPPHDHPWWSLAIILRGEYVDITENGLLIRRCGSVTLRSPKAIHKVGFISEAWSLFITGPKVKPWRFYPIERN